MRACMHAYICVGEKEGEEEREREKIQKFQ